MKWFGEKLYIRPIDFQKIKLNYKDGFYQIEFWSGKKNKIRQFRSIRQFAIKTLQKQYYSVDGVEWQNVQEWSDWTIENDVRAIVQSANVLGRSLCWTQHSPTSYQYCNIMTVSYRDENSLMTSSLLYVIVGISWKSRY